MFDIFKLLGNVYSITGWKEFNKRVLLINIKPYRFVLILPNERICLIMNAFYVAVAIVAVVLWVLFHKLFKVAYFGSLWNAILCEIFGCIVCSFFLVALVVTVGAKILYLLGGILAVLLKIALFIAVIYVVVRLIKKLIKVIKHRSNPEDSSCEADVCETVDDVDKSAESTNTETTAENPVVDTKAENANAGNTIEEAGMVDVVLTGFDASSKIKVVKTICEITGQGLADAKTMAEHAPITLKECVSQHDAEVMKKNIEGVGGKVELKPNCGENSSSTATANMVDQDTIDAGCSDPGD